MKNLRKWLNSFFDLFQWQTLRVQCDDRDKIMLDPIASDLFVIVANMVVLRELLQKIPTMWGPPVISWFRFAPVTIVIDTINHSYWSYVHQLSYQTGASHCMFDGKIHRGRRLLALICSAALWRECSCPDWRCHDLGVNLGVWKCLEYCHFRARKWLRQGLPHEGHMIQWGPEVWHIFLWQAGLQDAPIGL